MTRYFILSNLAELKVTSGAFSYQQAIAAAIKQVAKDGAYVLYPSGHRDRLDVAIRRNVMTGIGQTTGEICLANAHEMGCDLMEITAHAGARPSHASWQGEIVSLSGANGYLSLDDIGYGTGEGFKGWNCRHDWYPYFEGSTRMYSKKDLEELEEANIEYPDGSMHTYYEAEQMQRAYERKIRETKRTLVACDEALNNLSDEKLLKELKGEYSRYSVKLKEQRNELQEFCNATGLLADNSRSQAYGFGKSVSQKAVWSEKKAVANKAKKSIIRNIDIDDFEVVTYGKNIDSAVSNVIVETMIRCENNGGFIISKIVAKSIDATFDGTPVLQIEPMSNGLLQLNLNTDKLSGRTLEEIDDMFLNSELSIVNSLEEAIIHESGHALTINGKSVAEIEALYDELAKIHISGISAIATADGAECLAELEVLRFRGIDVSEQLRDFYKKYMRSDY